MPLVRILTSVAGVDFEWGPGDEVQMSASEARVWADGVRGELVRRKAPENPERARRDRTGDPETT